MVEEGGAEAPRSDKGDGEEGGTGEKRAGQRRASQEGERCLERREGEGGGVGAGETGVVRTQDGK